MENFSVCIHNHAGSDGDHSVIKNTKDPILLQKVGWYESFIKKRKKKLNEKRKKEKKNYTKETSSRRRPLKWLNKMDVRIKKKMKKNVEVASASKSNTNLSKEASSSSSVSHISYSADPRLNRQRKPVKRGTVTPSAFDLRLKRSTKRHKAKPLSSVGKSCDDLFSPYSPTDTVVSLPSFSSKKKRKNKKSVRNDRSTPYSPSDSIGGSKTRAENSSLVVDELLATVSKPAKSHFPYNNTKSNTCCEERSAFDDHGIDGFPLPLDFPHDESIEKKIGVSSSSSKDKFLINPPSTDGHNLDGFPLSQDSVSTSYVPCKSNWQSGVGVGIDGTSARLSEADSVFSDLSLQNLVNQISLPQSKSAPGSESSLDLNQRALLIMLKLAEHTLKAITENKEQLQRKISKPSVEKCLTDEAGVRSELNVRESVGKNDCVTSDHGSATPGRSTATANTKSAVENAAPVSVKFESIPEPVSIAFDKFDENEEKLVEMFHLVQRRLKEALAMKESPTTHQLVTRYKNLLSSLTNILGINKKPQRRRLQTEDKSVKTLVNDPNSKDRDFRIKRYVLCLLLVSHVSVHSISAKTA